MASQKIFRRTLGSFLVTAVFFIMGSPAAIAAGGSVYVQGLYPARVINPGTNFGFSASATGFTDPTYSVTDSFSASGATTGTVDKIGNYSWTPGVYDAGKHSLVVTVTDTYDHAASTTVDVSVVGSTAIVKDLLPGPVVAVRRPVSFTILTPGFVTPMYTVSDSSARSTLNSSSVSAAGLFSWIPTPDDVGTHVIKVSVSDSYGHQAQVTQTVEVIAPTVSIQSLKPGVASGFGSTVSFRANTNLVAATTFGVSDTFAGASTVVTSAINATGVFSWKSVASDVGLHSLTVTATDGYNNAASTTIDIYVTTEPATVAAPVATAKVENTSSTAVKSTSVALTKKYIFSTYLVVGSSGIAVKELQKRLTSLGLYSGPVTGYFGAMTSAAVKKFQVARGLARTGALNLATRTALNK